MGRGKGKGKRERGRERERRGGDVGGKRRLRNNTYVGVKFGWIKHKLQPSITKDI